MPSPLISLRNASSVEPERGGGAGGGNGGKPEGARDERGAVRELGDAIRGEHWTPW